MPNVFIVNRSSHDFSDAKRFGKLVFMTKGQFNRYATSRMYRAFEEFIEKSTEKDYILITSMNIMCCIACAMFAAKHKRINLLIYRSQEKYKDEPYLAREIVINKEVVNETVR